MSYSYDTHTIASIAPLGAALYANRPALGMVGEQAISYAELEACSRRTALRLIDAGVHPGDRVAILSESMPAWGIASFGIARAGAVAVPLLVDFKASQVCEILRHAGARIAFASKKQRAKLDESGVTILNIEDLTECARGDDYPEARSRLPEPSPDDLAAIVYTSGTTGNPKGVMLTHRNYLSDALACSSIIVLDTSDVLLSILPLAHAYEYTIGFLIPMMSGACIRYLDRPPSASALMPALAAVRPTIVLSVPLVIEKTYRSAIQPALEGMWAYRKIAALRPILERLAGARLYRSFGGRLRFFGIGGAPLDPEVERFLRTIEWPYAIGYGLTETAPIIAASAVGRTRPRAAGPALPGADIRIVDERPADEDPSIMVGELQVRGPMVGPGYYRDEARTTETRTDDGFFRTGDLGYRDGDGYFFVRGRLKSMIVGASGENIYPEEVEAELNRLPLVQESLVYNAAAGLTALVCLKVDAIVGMSIADALESIRKDVNKRLASFSRIVRIEHQPEAFEKTPTQKIKRFLYPRIPDAEAR